MADVEITISTKDASSGATKAMANSFDDLRETLLGVANAAEDEAEAVEQVTGATKENTESQEKNESGLQKLMGGIDKITRQYDGFKQILGDLQQVLDKTVGSYTRMADEVRTLSQFTGATYEETSRLIQVFDDAGIEVGQLRSAMRIMADNGLTPSIDAVATLADEYRALSDPQQRVTFLMENFGSRGVELGKVFEQTGDQIREAGAAIDEGMIFDEAKIAQTEKLRLTIDELNDRMQAFNNTMVGGLLPGFLQFIDGVELAALAWERWNKKLAEDDERVGKNARAQAAYQQRIRLTSIELGVTMEAAEKLVQQEDALAESTAKSDAQFYATTGTLQGYQRAMGDIIIPTQEVEGATNIAGRALDQYNEAIARVSQGMEDGAQAARDNAAAQQAMVDSANLGLDGLISNWKKKIEWLKGGGLELQSQFEQLGEAWTKATSPEEKAAIEGEMDTIFAKAEALQVRIGTLTAYEAAQKIADELGIPFQDAVKMVQDFQNKLDGIRNVDVNINVKINGGAALDALEQALADKANRSGQYPIGGGGGNTKKEPAGGKDAKNAGKQAFGGDYIVDEPTVFLAGEAGPERATFTPLKNGDTGGGVGGTTIINVYGQQAADVLSKQLAAARTSRISSTMGG